ncbi:transcription regulator hth lysr [Lucifera butyrica]|uniref:Transcription regulator hth lysr n=1 Tax=Lucifera butyrica TaxID=1351585 RepID=A0A498RBZ1_9FIRM|nr:LysR family transcriptional regulator [Lucifera butyrica]VBB07653.1 transcription regulator hth lysr [Lucifera butyrica]
MELRQLEYFRLAGRLGNMTRAAEQMHVAQPSVTVAIRKLEEELGIQLFERRRKQFILTPEGTVFLARTEDVLRRLEAAVQEMQDYRELQKGSIRLGVPPMIGFFLFPDIFSGFKKRYPQIDLFIIEEGSLSIEHLLEKGELDLGIIIFSQPSPVLTTIPLRKGEILLCLPPDHPLCQLERVPFCQVADYPVILLKENAYHRQLILEEFEKHAINPHVVLSSSQIETIKALVAKGSGISFLLDEIARQDNRIQCRSLENPLYISIGLVWKKDYYLSNAAKTLLDYIVSTA